MVPVVSSYYDLAPRFVWGHFSLGRLGNENGAPASEAT
jgi:hypothetical protein